MQAMASSVDPRFEVEAPIRAALNAANAIVQTTVDKVVADDLKAAAKAAKKESKAEDSKAD